MANAEDLLEQWLAAGQKLLDSQKGSERESALLERIDALEAAFKEKPKDERDEALEELDDEEWELIKAHREGKNKPPPAVADPPPPAAEEPTTKKTRPGRKAGQAYSWTVDDDGKVQRLDIPHVYTGADEPNEVELPDEVAEAVA